MSTPRKKILAVDNEPSVTLSLQYLFTTPDYELTCVDSGDAALRRLDAGFGPYDVIIVDQKMPHLTGVDLVDAIRQRGVNSRIIVVSAHLSSGVSTAFQEMGVHAMFGKPFDIAAIRAAVEAR